MTSWLLAAVIATSGDWEHAPKPDQFPVTADFAGTPAEVRLVGRRTRLFRTMLRRGALNGPNYAGHYTVVAWGCGLGAFELAIVDAKTGNVSWPPFGCMALAGAFGLPLEDPRPNPAFWLDSSLLVVAGVEDKPGEEPKDRAVRFYVFEGGRFRLIYRIPEVWPEIESQE
jgi:hypothetical protein